MPTEVPLTVYKDGKRYVIGRTIINDDNTFTAVIDDTPEARALLPIIHMGEVSIRRPIRLEHDEWAQSDILKRRFEDG